MNERIIELRENECVELGEWVESHHLPNVLLGESVQ